MLSKPIAYSKPTTTTSITLVGATTIDVTAVGAPYFPTLGAGEYVYAVLCSDPSFVDTTINYETVKVTAINTLALTVERNIESTDGAKEWPVGTYIVCPMTAKGWTEIETELGTLMPKAGATMTGTLAMGDNLITQPDIKDYVETVATDTWDSTTESVNLQNGNVHSVSITSDVTTLTFTNPRAGAHSFTLVIAQGEVLKDITWPASVDWATGGEPVMAINKTYWLTFVTLNGGTDWVGFMAGVV